MTIQFYPIQPTELYHKLVHQVTATNQMTAAEQKAIYRSNMLLFWHNMQAIFCRLAGITHPQVLNLAGRVCRYFAKGERCVQRRCRFYHCVATQYALETLKNWNFKTEKCPVPTVCELSGRKVACHRVHPDEPVNPCLPPKANEGDNCPILPGLEEIKKKVRPSSEGV